MGLADGDLYISGSILSYQQMIRIYTNFRGASVPSALKAGALWSKSSDDRLYHQGTTLDEVFTEKTTLTWENLLANSGFGVWSQSDAAKGLATMTYDTGAKGAGTAPSVGDAAVGGTSGATAKVISYTIATGTWDAGNATGVFILGACTGRFNDNETVTFGGVETCVVNQPDSAAGVDLMRNTDQWVGAAGATQPNGWAIGTAGVFTIFDSGDGAPYDKCLKIEVNATPAANPWIKAIITTEIGKIYTFRFKFKHGTATLGLVGLGTSAGGIQYKEWRITDAAWTEYSHTFEAMTTTTHLHLQALSAVAGQFELFDEISLYEITPCCTAANTAAMDDWYKDATLDLYRQHNDGGTYTKDGSFYSLKMVPTAAGDFIRIFKARILLEELAQQFAGRTVTAGKWIKTSTANHARLRFFDGVTSTYGSYHTGGGAWEWLEVTKTISGAATQFFMSLTCVQAPNVDGSTIVYVSQPTMVFGSHIGEGNYQPKQQEIIWMEKYIPSNRLNVLVSQSGVAFTDLNVEADSDAMLPKGCKAIHVYSDVRDSLSIGNDVFFRFRADAIQESQYIHRFSGIVNDLWSSLSGWQKCDTNGDVDYQIGASAATNFDFNYVRYLAVQVN